MSYISYPYTLSLSKEKIEDLNLDISLASSDLQLVKQVKVTDVNDVFCCLLLSHTAKKLYNSSLYLFKQQYKQNQTTLTYETLDKLMKNEKASLHPNFAKLYKDLPAKVSQQVLKLFSQNIKSFFALKQSEKLTEEERKKVNLPRYYSKNGLIPVYYTSQAISKKAFNKEGIIHFSGTDLKIKLDEILLQEIKNFSQINQVRIVPSTRNDKNQHLSDLLNKRDLFTIEIVYTVPKSEKRISEANKSLELLYRTSILHKINKKTNKIATIEKEELVGVRYTEDFLKSVAGIDQNLDQLAVGIVLDKQETLSFNYDIKYLKSVNQYWNKRKAKLQEEISKQEKLLEELKYAKLDFYQTFLTEYTTSRLIEDTKILIKKLKNKIKRITTKRNRKIDNYTHQLSRKLINHLSELGVKNIIYGKNVNFKKEISLGKVNNQNFVNKRSFRSIRLLNG